MRHAKGYAAYAKADGLKPHDVAAWEVDGKVCCASCTYPLAGKTYRVEIERGFMLKLLIELKGWGAHPSCYNVKGDVLYTTDTNVVDVATETFMNARHLISITTR